ncbi:uncharacterized protein LOC120667673 [Panicum virgatum]|uniref:Uncharacterized protein n=1 Tax=Panicum virgatum TaxID=38727 RepID=A0A8T0U6Q5_PANVG|nr:uncharacterized protein LOC120667673 [Panicum virgatum]KAG2618540.1 hypothetical protein PVAP13_3NG079644 [Panicum virgatum]
MAYRRKQGIQRSATFVEDHRQASSGGSASPAIASPRATRFADDNRWPERSSGLAARVMVAPSAARGDLTLPAFGDRFAAAAAASHGDSQPSSPIQDPVTQLYTSTSMLNDDGPKYDLDLSKKDEARHGLWSLVAQKAKVMLDENGTPRAHSSESRWSYDRVRSSEISPTSRKGAPEGKLDIGGKIKNVLEQEGLTVADNATPGSGGAVVAGRKLQIRRKACSMDFRRANLVTSSDSSSALSEMDSPQIKASRDVANAMAAKVKLLQRELKTLKADLAFSKERCAQLEEENRQLRDGNHDADEDMIRQQLETLLAEKARLANENTLYARENRFLREIVEYHQLNMQDVVNLDEDDIEEEDEDDVDEEADAGDEEEEEKEAEQYQSRGSSLPTQLVQEEEEEHQAAGPGAAPALESPSRRRESPRIPGTNGGDTTDRESPRRMNTNSGDAVDYDSPRRDG